MRARVLVLVMLALAGARCGSSDSVVATAPSPFAGTATEVYADTLSAGGTGFYAFSVFARLTVRVTFASITSKATGAILPISMNVGLGIPQGTGCALLKIASTPAALSAQITADLDPGIYCVSLADTGGLSADANFAVRINQGTLNLASTGSPATFASNLAKNGASVRMFAAGTAGTVTATLDSVSPSTVVGFGLGVWNPVASTCSLLQIVNASGGASLTAAVDQGLYCVRVFDVGNLSDFVAFSVTIRNP